MTYVTWAGEAVGKQLLIYRDWLCSLWILVQYLLLFKLCFGLNHPLGEMSHSLNAPLISLAGAGLCGSTRLLLLWSCEVGVVRTKQRNWKMLKRSVDLKLTAELWSNYLCLCYNDLLFTFYLLCLFSNWLVQLWYKVLWLVSCDSVNEGFCTEARILLAFKQTQATMWTVP